MTVYFKIICVDSSLSNHGGGERKNGNPTIVQCYKKREERSGGTKFKTREEERRGGRDNLYVPDGDTGGNGGGGSSVFPILQFSTQPTETVFTSSLDFPLFILSPGLLLSRVNN